jgi:NADH:ubiquinone oxidoreductase subunit D
MHCAYLCLLGCLDDISFSVIDFLWSLILSNLFLLEMFDFVCVNNRIGYLRMRGIGLLDIYDLTSTSISGVLGRSVGFL